VFPAEPRKTIGGLVMPPVGSQGACADFSRGSMSLNSRRLKAGNHRHMAAM